MSTPVTGPLAVTPLYLSSGNVAAWWDDPGATWQLVDNLSVGSLTPDTTFLHEATGGFISITGNLELDGDASYLYSGDLSVLASATVTGTPTPGETPGLDITLGGVLYAARYTVQAGDTNNAIALGLCGAIATTPGLMDAFAAFTGGDGIGYFPVQVGCPGQVSGNVFYFDMPFGASNNLVGHNTAHTTVAVPAFASLTMDGNPTFVMQRGLPGIGIPRAMISGDRLSQIIFQTSFTSYSGQTGAITQTATGANSVEMGFNVLIAGAPQEVLRLGPTAVRFMLPPVFQGLPNSASGLSSGAIYYDPADGNRVKYVP